MTDQSPILARDIDAALAWWRAAGVDCDFTADARAWLAEPAPASAPASAGMPAALRGADGDMRPGTPPPAFLAAPDTHAAAAGAVRADLLGDSPPQTLAEFHAWWMANPLPGDGGLYPRIAPRGQAGARLMVIVPDPEADDRDSLLAGQQGRLLSNILVAMGLAPADCYIASALPCHTPRADLAGMAQTGLDRVLALHVALAAPHRAIAFGQGLGPFLGAEIKKENQPLREINYAQISTPIMITENLASMCDMPRLKARFWRRWMEWAA